MYMTGNSHHTNREQAVQLAAKIKPEGGRCILRPNYLGGMELINLSPAPMHQFQPHFIERADVDEVI